MERHGYLRVAQAVSGSYAGLAALTRPATPVFTASAAGGWVTAAEVTAPGYLRLLRETATGGEAGSSAGKGRNLCLGHRGMGTGVAASR